MKLLLFVGSLLASCGILYIASQPPHPQAQTETAATIAGNVTLRGAPVPGVAILVEPPRPGSGQVSSTKTAENGQFRISNLRPGIYTVKVKAPGLVSLESSPGMVNREVTLDPGEVRENVDFSLIRGGVISGKVTDNNGSPVVDQMISITGPSPYGPTPSIDNYSMMSTDDRGSYRIYGLPPGRYKVSVGVGGGSRYRKLDNAESYYPHTYHPNVSDESKASIIEVAEGGEVGGIDIVVGPREKTYEATGRIVNAVTGQPQTGIKWGYDGHAISTFGRLSDERGGFRITGLMPGRYSVFAGCEGDFYSGKLEFEITDKNINNLEIRRNPGGSLRGRVLVEGTNDPAVLSKLPQIMLIARSNTGYVNANLAPDGSFYFCGLQPGKQKIEASSRMRGGFGLMRVEHKGVELSKEVDIAVGEHLTDVKVVLAYSTGVIRGQVKIENYELPPGVRLRIVARRVGEVDISSFHSAETDGRYRFVIEGLAPGEYILSTGGYVSSVPNFRSPGLTPIQQRVIVSNGTESTVSIDLKANK
jgi:hypothetical protein